MGWKKIIQNLRILEWLILFLQRLWEPLSPIVKSALSSAFLVGVITMVRTWIESVLQSDWVMTAVVLFLIFTIIQIIIHRIMSSKERDERDEKIANLSMQLERLREHFDFFKKEMWRVDIGRVL